MNIEDLLTDEALDFSRRHLTSYYDTDFFPKPFEFWAIWHKWDELKKINRRDLLANKPPVGIPWKKSKGGFRIVHQMDPLDSLVYTALTYSIAKEVESNRQDASTACSYRISIEGNGFFEAGSGFENYRKRCEVLAEYNKYVLTTDISDFYNQIYLHRLENAISNSTNSNAGKVFERFLMNINNRNSQGIPVGPAASIVLSEAALIDVDEFIQNRGFEHVRYVDDIRIFSDSRHELDILLQEVSLYLHQNHRLGVVGDKTKIIESQEFLQEELNNQYQMEKLEIFADIESANNYGFSYSKDDESNEDDHKEDEEDDIGEKLLESLERIRKYEHLDLGLARAILRRARIARAVSLIDFLMNDIIYFRAVTNDVVLYLEAVTSPETYERIKSHLLDLASNDIFYDKAICEWFAWYIGNHKLFLRNRTLRGIFNNSDRNRLSYSARAAVTIGNVSWVREYKDKVLDYATWDRRAIIYSAQILSEDEKTHWLSQLRKNKSLDLLDIWMIDWVLDGTPQAAALTKPMKVISPVYMGTFDDFEDDLPF